MQLLSSLCEWSCVLSQCHAVWLYTLRCWIKVHVVYHLCLYSSCKLPAWRDTIPPHLCTWYGCVYLVISFRLSVVLFLCWSELLIDVHHRTLLFVFAVCISPQHNFLSLVSCTMAFFHNCLPLLFLNAGGLMTLPSIICDLLLIFQHLKRRWCVAILICSLISAFGGGWFAMISGFCSPYPYMYLPPSSLLA